MQAVDAARARALDLFGSVLQGFSGHFLLGDVIAAAGEPFTSQSESLVATFMNRKTGTLTKRAGTLRLYLALFRTSGFNHDAVFTEPTAFAYVKFLVDEGAGATCGIAFTQALNFVAHLMGNAAAGVACSPRVRGLALKLLKSTPPREREPNA